MNIKNLLRLCFIVFTISAITAGVTSYFVWDWLHTPKAIEQNNRTVVIEKGKTLHSLSRELKKNGMIDWPRLWVLYARMMDLTKIKAGEYRLTENESPVMLLTRFQSGDVIQYQVTLVEGLTIKDAVLVLHSNTRIKRETEMFNDIGTFNVPGVNEPHLEGWIFPDTYRFTAGDSDVHILQRAYKKMQRVLSEEWQSRADNLPYMSKYDALIMASIVEKETGAPHERTEIAGVFVRRLRKGMRLQTDPTVIYGMGQSYTGNITRADLKRPTPYNTYVINGLPPTPIALPGRAAIHAALNPAEGSSLYFVARGDGSHYFSDTLDEHIRAVNRFQKQRREGYRSDYRENNDVK